ncbi:MAG: PQQ-binding-like beta-propeller repeat protein [Sedimentisphaerales bacterium]|nr:PQQ-binding-like beta-propeller repeat protein [Sedimentisphaerales bacterium]
MRISGKSKMDVSQAGFILAVAMLLLSSSGTAADDWPIYRGPNHNGFSNETGWNSEWGTAGPKKLWTKSIGVGFSSITVADGRAYMTGNSGEKSGAKDTVFCLDANTGKEIWKHTFDCPLEAKYYEGGTLASPTADGKVVYTISKMGDLFCLDAATGKVVWQKNVNKEYGFKLPTWHFAGSPMVVGNMLVFNLGNAGAAIDKQTGALVWDNGKDICGYATPVPCKIEGADLLVIAGADSLAAARPADGKVLWTHEFVNKHKVSAADPIISGTNVFASSGYNRGCMLIDVAGGNPKQIYDNREMRNHMNCSMLYEGHIYGFDENNLKCIGFKDGAEKWSDGSMGKGALMMSVDGRMIIMSDKGELVIAKADPSSFKVLARAQILPTGKCWTVPVLSNGKIYARNARGDAVCVDVSGK